MMEGEARSIATAIGPQGGHGASRTRGLGIARHPWHRGNLFAPSMQKNEGSRPAHAGWEVEKIHIVAAKRLEVKV